MCMVLPECSEAYIALATAVSSLQHKVLSLAEDV